MKVTSTKELFKQPENIRRDKLTILCMDCIACKVKVVPDMSRFSTVRWVFEDPSGTNYYDVTFEPWYRNQLIVTKNGECMWRYLKSNIWDPYLTNILLFSREWNNRYFNTRYALELSKRELNQ
uniref:Uncharacterized protein n=1 Tax=viral metagenome TaxID=1070528 RepID=A0A6C0CM72_9ZZZZ